jgi:hypothetical protein
MKLKRFESFLGKWDKELMKLIEEANKLYNDFLYEDEIFADASDALECLDILKKEVDKQLGEEIPTNGIDSLNHIKSEAERLYGLIEKRIQEK